MSKTVLIALAAMLSGCATQSYSRLEPVSADEAVSCARVDAEIARAEGFRAEVVRGGDKPWWAATAHIADISTGNSRERRAATRSAEARLDQLHAVRDALGCST